MSTEQVTFTMPTDPAVLIKIGQKLQQVADSKLRQKGETALQTDIFKVLAEETGIPNGVLRKLANIQSDGGIDKLTREVEDLDALHQAVKYAKAKQSYNNGSSSVNPDQPDADEGVV